MHFLPFSLCGPQKGRNKMGRVKLSILLFATLFLVCAGCRQSPRPESLRAPDQQSSAVKDRSGAVSGRRDIGFATRQKFLDHYEKHGTEFGSISREEYLRQAQILRDSPAGDEILEIVRADGVITRFDRKSGAFIAFNPDLTIRTYFKPNDGERYFRRQSKR